MRNSNNKRKFDVLTHNLATQNNQSLWLGRVEINNNQNIQAENRKISEAMYILCRRMKRKGDVLNDTSNVKKFLHLRFHNRENECFCALLLDSQHQLIHFEEISIGTIDEARIYPREVVKLVLKHNAAAVIFAHNHPSGKAEPSQADICITEKLKNALELIDVKTLDHFVCGNTEIVSLAEIGKL